MALRDELQTTLGAAYTLERELGGGGMSRVFVAEETALGRRVVVKVLPPELVAGVNVERFNREILVAARLQHPHIVPVHSAGEMAGVPYYTMPYVEGESLRVKLARTGPLSITEAIGVLRDVAKALAYAHERNIVHRDIKPDNVLLSGGSATVTDFGIAKAIAAARTDGGSATAGTATLTQMGTSLGTPAYMAPEQAAADPSSDARADIYSFGCMAYEVLTGRPPFVAKTPQKLLAAQMAETPEDVRTQRPDTPGPLAELVMRCLEKDAGHRPQRASDVVQVLETVTSGGGHAAMPPILLGGKGMFKKALGLYAAAFVFVAVLSKAAIVAIGLPDWVFPGSLIVMALGLPVILFTAYVHHTTRRAVTQTPTFTPGGTPSSIHGTMATLALKASPHVSWRRAGWGGVAALSAFMLLIVGYMVMRGLGIGPFGSLMAAGTLTKNEKLLVADFNSSDSTLGPVVTEAFRTALGQSRSISVMPVNVMRDALRRMQKPQNTKVDFTVAREMATREGIKAVVTGEILGVGGSYALAVKLISPQSGDELANFRKTANDQKDILPTLDDLAKELRAKIGESLRSVQATEPLARVTTPSLEALKKYVQGARVIAVEGDFARGSALMEEAIALDTGFAMAYRRLAVEYNNRAQNDKAMELLQKAYNHADRLSDAERYMLMGTYYQMGPKQDIVKSNSAFESLIELQPDYGIGYNNVANNYRYQRNWAKAEQYYKKVISLGSPITVYFSNLTATQVQMGKRDDALRTLAAFDSTLPGNPSAKMSRANVMYVEGKYDSAATIYRAVVEQRASDLPTHAAAATSLSNIARTRGKLTDAAKWDADAAAVNAKRGIAQAELQRSVAAATARAWFLGDAAGTVTLLDNALRQTPLEKLPVSARPYGDIVFAYATAGRPDKAREIFAIFERGQRDVVVIADERERHRMLADIALAEKKYDDAIREARASDLGTCVICAMPVLARAYDLSGQSDSAIAVFERYNVPVYYGRTIDQLYLAGIHKRLGELYETKKDKANARLHYTKFIELWKDSDTELQPKVAEVRARLARLGDSESR